MQHHMITANEDFKSAISLILTELSLSLNLQYNFTPDQIRQIPNLLKSEEFYSLSIEDIVLLCKRIKIGQYGVLYRMDIPTFFELLRRYNNEKMGIIIEENEILKENLTIYNHERLFDKLNNEIEKCKDAMHNYRLENFKNNK